MTAINTYATLAEYKAFVTARGQSSTTDATDDTVIDNLLEQASRYIDSKTARWFYPRIEQRYYSIPDTNKLGLDADLLAVITFLNGDDTSIASTEYNLLPRNYSPKYAIELTDVTSVVWEDDSNQSVEFVLDLTGIFGFHDRYDDAWTTAGTLGAAMSDTTTASLTMTGGHSVAVGEILKVDNELFIPSAVVTNAITLVARGDNGSTAATHSNGATVSTWQPMEEARNAVLETASQAYKRRFGKSNSNISTVTAAGVMLTPRDIPALTEEFIAVYRRIV
jgi:hypothetical protein